MDVFIGGNALVSGTSHRDLALAGQPTMGAGGGPVQLEWADRPGVAVPLDGGKLAGAASLLARASGGTGGAISEAAAACNAFANKPATTNIVNRVRDLTIQAANGSLTDPAKEAIAVELEGLNKDLLSQANTQYPGRNIFAGSSDTSGAFNNATPPVFNGTPGSTVERRIDANQTVRVDADGGAIFGDGAGSVFALVSNVVADIRSGANVSARLPAIADRINTVIAGRTEVGERQAKILSAQDTNDGMKLTLDAQRSGIEDADIGKVVLDLKLQETNYQVALAVTAKTL